MGSTEKKTILQQGQEFTKELTKGAAKDKKNTIAVEVETGKGAIGYVRKFEHGQIGAEVELEKDQKPKYKGGGSFNW